MENVPEIRRGSRVTAGAGGGSIELLEEESGELLAVFDLSAGEHGANRYLPFVGPGQRLEPGANVVVWNPPARVAVMDFGAEAFTSAANPDYVVTPAQRHVRDLERRMRRLEALERVSLERSRREAAGRGESRPVSPDALEEAHSVDAAEAAAAEVVEPEPNSGE